MIKITSIDKTIIYLLVFLFTLHVTPATYINSSFLGQFLDENKIGIVYSVASLFTIFSFLYTRKILNRFGNFKTFLVILLFEIVTLLTMAFVDIGWVAILAYIIGFTIRSIAFFNMDIFLENITKDEDTGGTRGVYLTSMNTAFIVGPFIAGFILSDHDFWKIYLLSTILLMPVLYIILKYLRNFEDPKYEKPELFKTAKCIYNHSDYYGIFAASFLLRFFYSFMIIYTPIYLNQYIGFSLSEVTLIIGIALIPFILLEALLGWLADNYVGEKEILTAGFIITAGATALMSFFHEPKFILWAGILFTTRIGASMIEIMTETYLFKKIDVENINVLSFFRIIRPIAYVISPLVVSFMLYFIDFRFIFLMLASFVLFGIRYSLSIRDTL